MAAASASVRTALSLSAAGRSNGVSVGLTQTPWRPGCPKDVLAGVHAVCGALDCAPSGPALITAAATSTIFRSRRITSSRAVSAGGFRREAAEESDTLSHQFEPAVQRAPSTADTAASAR